GVVGTDLVLTVNGITATRALQLVSSVLITGAADLDDTLTLLGSIPVPVTFDGGERGSDTLRGPTTDVTWTIDGTGSGSVAGVLFSGVENLTGAPGNQDTFVFEAGGAIAGLVDGGAGGFDTIELPSGPTVALGYAPSGPDSGLIDLNGTTIAFAGLEPVLITGLLEDIVVTFTATNANAVLEQMADGSLRLVADPTDPDKFEEFGFPVPTRSLTIYMFLPGAQTPGSNLTIGEVDLGTARLTVDNADTLIVAGDLTVHGTTENDGVKLGARSLLRVNDGVTIDAGNADIALAVNATHDLQWEAFVPQFQDREAHGRLEVGVGATLLANNITVTVDSKVRQLELFEIDQLLIEQAAGTVFTALLSEGTPVVFAPVIDPAIGVRAPDLITRTNGTWVLDGFTAGSWIHVAGSVLNDGFYRVVEISPDGHTIRLDPDLGDRFVLPEVALSDDIEIEEVVVGQSFQGAPPVLDIGVTLSFAGNTIERHDGRQWAQDGFRVGQSLIVTDTPGAANDNSYEITAINGQFLEVNAGGRLVSQPMVTDAIVYAPGGSPGDIPLAVLDPNVRMTPLEVELQFAGSTITRNAGDWLADGFAANQLILVTGATANAGTFEVVGVSPGVLTISRPAFVTETVSTGVDVATVVAAQPAGALDDLYFVFDHTTATITRSDGKAWAADGFAPNQRIQVTGSQSNDGTYLVAGVDGVVLQLAAGTVVVDESTKIDPLADPEPAPAEIVSILISLIRPQLTFDGVTITRSAGSWTQDGFVAGDRIVVDGTLDNNGHYRIAQITPTVLTLDPTTPVQAHEESRTADVTRLRPYEEVDPDPADGQPLTVRDVTDALILPVARLTSPLQGYLAQAVTHTATAELVIRAGAFLNATGNIVVRSVATAKMLLETEGLYLGITLGESTATGTVDVETGARLQADSNGDGDGDVEVRAGVQHNVEVATAAAAKRKKITKAAIPGPVFSAAMLVAQSTSRLTIAPGAIVEGQDVGFWVLNSNSFIAESASKLRGRTANTGLAFAIAINENSSEATVSIGGTVRAANDVTVSANSTNKESTTLPPKEWDPNPDIPPVIMPFDSSGNFSVAKSTFRQMVRTAKGPLALAAATVLATSTNDADAEIADGASVSARHDLNVEADAEDNFKAVATGKSKVPSAITIAGAYAELSHANRANAHIGDGARVNAARALLVSAHAIVPNQIIIDDMFRALLAGPLCPTDDPRPNCLRPPPVPSLGGGDPVQQAEAAVNAVQQQLAWSQEQSAIALGYLSTILPLLIYKRWLPYLIATTNLQALAGYKTGGAIAVAGTKQILDVTNESEAWIGADALVNTEADPDFAVTASPDQRVEVRAKTEIETIEVSGITDPLEVLKLLKLSGPGTSGKFGVGAADHEMHLQNGARAHIDDGAQVHAQDGIAVLAEIRQWHISVAQQGGDAPLLGASGAKSDLDITNVALAWVEDSARLDAGGDIEIDASNDFFVVAVTAAMQKGGLVAAGVGIAVNSFDTTTRAFIGNVNGPAVAPGSPVVFIKAGGGLRVHATSNEELWSFAAAAASPSKGTATASGLFGFSVSTSIAANYIEDLTEAYVASAGAVQAGGDIDVLAQTTSFEVAVAGAVSISKARNAITLAGAFAWNELTGAGRTAQRGVDPGPRITRAYVASRLVAAGNVRVRAIADDTPVTITASFGAALPKNGSGVSVDVAGAATVGRYVSLVEAYIGAGVAVNAGGDLVVRASRSLDLLSITGALAFKGTLAAGAAIEETLTRDAVLAYVGDGANLDVRGNLEVVSTTSVTVLSLVAAQVVLANVAAAAGSSNVMNLGVTARAYLGEHTVTVVGNEALIAAGETTTLSATAGGRTLAGGAGVGLSYGELQISRILDAGLRAGASLDQGRAPLAGHTPPSLRGSPISGIRIDADASDDLRLTVAAGAISGALAAALSPALTLASYTVTAGADAATLLGRTIVLAATSAPRMWSLAVAGSVATSRPGLSGGGAGGGGPPIADILAKLLSLAGAAAGVSTTLTSIAKATITGGSVTATGGPVTLRAENRVEVKADAGGVGIAASRGPVGGSIGASAAVTELFMQTTAAIDDAPVAATGDITLTATARPVIWSMSVAGAVTPAVGGGGGFSFSFAGAGAASTNTVTSAVVARLARNGTVTSSAGAIRLTANSDSSIYADAGAVALTLAKGGANFTGAASIAANHITQTNSAIAEGAALRARDDIELAATTGGTIDALTIAGGGGGSMGSGKGISVNFAGASTGSANVITTTTEARVSDGSATSLLGAVAISATDDSTVMADAGAVVVALTSGVSASVGRSVAVNEITSVVRAGIDTASVVSAHDDVRVLASSVPTIDARTLAGAIAAGTGGGSAALTISVVGAASGSRNTVISTTEAYVRNTTTVDAGGTVKVSATDASSIVGDAGGFALSLQYSSGAFVSAAVGLSIALNEITATVAASIENAAVTKSDDVVVEAISTATIDALTIAGALGALAGTGARSQNTIDKTVSATVVDSDVDASLGVRIAAAETSAVMTDAGGLAVAEKVGSGTSLPAAGFGETIAVNAIDVEVRAAVDGSALHAGGDVTVDGRSTTSIDARTETTTDAVAIGGAGGPLGSAFVGAATAAGNDIHNTVSALVTHGSDVTADGAVAVTAGSSGTINAEAQSAALAITTAGTSANVTVGGATALNVVRGGTHAEIGAEGTDHVISAAAALTVAAADARSIDSLAYARTFSASTGTGTLNIALGRALADNTIAAAVTAIIRAARVLSASLVSVIASDSAAIDARTIATASAFAWGSHAIEAAAAGAESTNRIVRTVDASIEN
ncbi:MAG: hypothetical protein QOJ89_4364, partial [bacterium]